MDIQAEHHLVDQALQALRNSTGIGGQVAVKPRGGEPLLRLKLPHGSLSYRPVTKASVDRIATLALLKAQVGNDSLLITHQLSQEMGTKCREMGIQFLDAAGNIYLNDRRGTFVFVVGRKEHARRLPILAKHPRATTPAALRLTFALLANTSLLNAPLREIAAAAGVSVGLAGQAVNALQARGYIGIDGSGKRAFLNRRHLVVDWASGYINRLKPKLQTARFSVPDPEALGKWEPGPGIAAWSGEIAAARLTNMLKPASLTLYQFSSDANLTASLVKNFRLKKEENGTLEIVDAFWNPQALNTGKLVPPELVYADLMATLDDRNLETAKHLLDSIIGNA